MELVSKFNTLNFDFNSLDRLYTTLATEDLEGGAGGERDKQETDADG